MRKKIFGRKLKRDTNERKALFKGLATSLVLYEEIKTTEEKAKSIKSMVDKLVTKAKKKEMASFELLQSFLTPTAAKKLIVDIAPRFLDRNGGYTRIVRLGKRLNDGASTVLMEWVEKKSHATKADESDKDKDLKKSKAQKALPKKIDAKGKTKSVKKTARKTTKKKV